MYKVYILSEICLRSLWWHIEKWLDSYTCKNRNKNSEFLLQLAFQHGVFSWSGWHHNTFCFCFFLNFLMKSFLIQLLPCTSTSLFELLLFKKKVVFIYTAHCMCIAERSWLIYTTLFWSQIDQFHQCFHHYHLSCQPQDGNYKPENVM